MQTKIVSRLLAFVLVLVCAGVSFSALAGWFSSLSEGLPNGAPEPLLLLTMGLALISTGLFIRAR